jgi:hypothetical protein
LSDLEIAVSNRAMELIEEGISESDAWAQAIAEILPRVPKRKPKHPELTDAPPPGTTLVAEFLSDALSAARRIAEADGTDPETAWQYAVTETLHERRLRRDPDTI